MNVIHRFYDAFARRDWATMGACYHADARFSDPVFPDLNAAQVRAMWKMLLTSGTDLRVNVLTLDEKGGRCRWEARYTFSRTGRTVHNIITSEFTFKEGLIHSQLDHFGFWRWSRQALGAGGWILGWSPVVRNKVRRTAAAALRKAMAGSATP